MNEDLPKGWSVATLADLVATDGLFCDGDWVATKDQDPSGSVRLTQLADVGDGVWLDRSNRWMTEERSVALRCTYLEPSDVLIARMAHPLGRACLFPGACSPCVTVVDVAVVRPGSGSVHGRWLMHAVNSPSARVQIESMQAGTTRKRISRKNLGIVKLLVPPVAEQHRITDELERRLSHVDAAVRSLEVCSRRLASARQAVAQSLVLPGRGGTDPDGLPLLPDGWSWTNLGEVATVVGGVTKDAKKESDPNFVSVPYLRVANVQRGRLDLEDVTSIRVPTDKIKALRLEPGDVLFTEGGDRDKLGRGWVWEGQISDCIHQNHVFRARLNEPRLHPKFVSWVGNTFGRKWFEAAGKQTTNLASVNKRTLEAFPVPLPPPGAASEIVTEIDRRVSLIDAAEAIVSANLAKAAQLRASLLAAAFSGQLVPQDPADEPAEALLTKLIDDRSQNSRRAVRRRVVKKEQAP